MDANGSGTPQRTTELVYRRQINRVVAYIQRNPDGPHDLHTLAQVAGFSPYHFHRIFSAFVGQTVGDFLRSLRLSQAAFQLLEGSQPVTEIALQSGYETPAAFSKAFKGRFGCSPSAYRLSGGAARAPRRQRTPPQNRRDLMQAQIKELPELRVLYVRRRGLIDNNFDQAAKESFDVLFEFIRASRLNGQWELCLGVTPEEDVPPEEMIYDGGVTLKPGVEVQPKGEVAIQVLPAGRYAVFLHVGPYNTLWQSWNAIYREWLPESGMKLRDASPFEVYLDSPDTPPQKLRSEIYIPIE